jgi:hypothetical protein
MIKKLLLIACVAPVITFAQILQSDQFTTLTAGNIGTDITGAAAGQNNWFIFSNNGAAPTTSTNAAASNFIATATGNPSNGISLVGPNGDKGARYMWKNGLPAAWASRTVGNNIIEVEVDINTGALSTSRNNFGVYIFNEAGDRVLAGFSVRAATRELFLVAYSTPTGNPVGSYSYSLAAAPGIQLAQNAWSRIGFSFNTVTGRALIKAPGIDPLGAYVDGSSPNTSPGEVDFVSFSGHTTTVANTSSTSMTFDNLVVRASSTDTLLGNEDFTGKTLSAILYPNPASDVLNIQSATDEITKITITDLNGRIVKEVTSNLSQISLENIAKGIYMVTLESDTAKKIEKLIIE